MLPGGSQVQDYDTIFLKGLMGKLKCIVLRQVRTGFAPLKLSNNWDVMDQITRLQELRCGHQPRLQGKTTKFGNFLDQDASNE
jgi:hypothetical protein